MHLKTSPLLLQDGSEGCSLASRLHLHLLHAGGTPDKVEPPLLCAGSAPDASAPDASASSWAHQLLSAPLSGLPPQIAMKASQNERLVRSFGAIFIRVTHGSGQPVMISGPLGCRLQVGSITNSHLFARTVLEEAFVYCSVDNILMRNI